MSQDAATRKRVQRESWRQKAEEHRTERAAPPEDRSWRAEAACRHMDPEGWVMENEQQPGARCKIAAAKLVCAGCPVRLPCLAYALETSQVGVWAGTTARERQRIRRRRNLGG